MTIDLALIASEPAARIRSPCAYEQDSRLGTGFDERRLRAHREIQ
jgi:hypothetical protein